MPQMAMHVWDGHSMMHDPISRHCLAECKLFVRGSAANSSPVISSGPSTLESMGVVRVCTFFASFQFGGSPCGVTWSAPRVGNNLASPEILNKVHCSKTHPARVGESTLLLTVSRCNFHCNSIGHRLTGFCIKLCGLTPRLHACFWDTSCNVGSLQTCVLGRSTANA